MLEQKLPEEIFFGKEIQKGKRLLLITAYHPIKTQNQRFDKILYARKCKFVLGLKNRISFSEIGNLFKSFTSLVMNKMT